MGQKSLGTTSSVALPGSSLTETNSKGLLYALPPVFFLGFGVPLAAETSLVEDRGATLLLNHPNKISLRDSEGRAVQRGSKSLTKWHERYTAMAETQDQGLEPQRGAWMYGRCGRGVHLQRVGLAPAVAVCRAGRFPHLCQHDLSRPHPGRAGKPEPGKPSEPSSTTGG
jgi:hypothetical protein